MFRLTREDPHLIYDWLLERCPPLAHRALMLRRYTACWILPTWFLRVLFIIADDVSLAFFARAKIRRRRIILVREFSAAWLIVAPLLGHRRILLNVNHNLLSGRPWRRNACRILSRFYRVVMFSPNPGLCFAEPWLSPLRIVYQSSDNRIRRKRIVLMIGSRPEQRSPELGVLAARIIELVSLHGFELVVYGAGVVVGLVASRPSRQEYIDSLTGSLCVVAFDPLAYNDRHSGSIWDCARFAHSLVYPATATLRYQTRGMDHCYSYVDIESASENVFRIMASER
jgi:hypothetical protein